MKKILSKIAVAGAALLSFGALTLSSCSDFFDMADSATLNEDSVFLRIANTRKLLYRMYTANMNTAATHYGSDWKGANERRLRQNFPDVLSDLASGYTGSNTDNSPRFYNAQLTSGQGSVVGCGLQSTVGNTTLRGEYIFKWDFIRAAHLLIRRVDEVADATDEEKGSIKAEAQIFVAWTYFEMMRRFGGMPLVRKPLNDPSEFRIARSSLADTYAYILEMLDAAIENPHLPARRESADFGRYTKAFAYALKAKVMLTAASPLFNTATPYMELPGHNELICFGNYDRERWKLAADAATEAIAYCEANGYRIVDNQESPELNYKVATNDLPSNGNTELVYGWTERVDPNVAPYFVPRGTLQGWCAVMPTHNLVEMYRNTDGTFTDWSQPVVTSPGKPSEPYEKLEPRFHATLGYNGCAWKRYDKSTFVDYTLGFYDGVNGAASGNEGYNKTSRNQMFGYCIRKYVYGHEGQAKTGPTWWVIHLNMRLADLYMMRAEALNEYHGGPAGSCVADLNRVLNRSGMSCPEGMDYRTMQRFIERERAIEFCFEDQRYMDLKRTLRAVEVLNFDAVDARCTRDKQNVYTYKRTVVQQRKFLEKYYLWPFTQSEINKNYGLIQNPGW